MRKNLLLKLLLFILFSTLLSSFCFAQVTTAWVRRYDGPESDRDFASSMAVDAAGNVYVTGTSEGAAIFESDFVTIKYNAFGTEQWIRRYNSGPGITGDNARALTVDAAGNVYVTGTNSNEFGFGRELITIKYNSVGNELWIKSYNIPGETSDNACGIAVDAFGNVYVLGWRESGGPSVPNVFSTIKYDADGNELWVRHHPGISNGIVVDASGNVYVTGYNLDGIATIKYDTNGIEIWLETFDGGFFVSRNGIIAVDASGNVYLAAAIRGMLSHLDFLTIKYANEGTLVWARQYNGPANGLDHSEAVVVDNAGNVYVTGTQAPIGTCPPCVPENIITIKYNISGDELWVREYNGPTDGRDFSASIALDELGNVYIAGQSVVESHFDYAVIKYNADGIPQWEERYDDGRPTSLTVDAWGNVYVTGSSHREETSWDYATIKYAQPSPFIVAAGLDLTIFQGFGSLCATLSAEASGGLPPYEYSWLPGQFTTQNILVCPTKTISYAVTAMDAGKNKAMDEVKVYVIDVRCGKNLDKVLVCHKGKKELCISVADVKEHLAHGDVLGACKAPPVPSDNPARPGIPKLNVDVPSKFSVTNYPNPVSATTRFQYEIPFYGQVSIKMYDVSGREVATLVNATRKAGYHSTDFDASSLPKGVYYYKALLHAGEKEFTRSGKIMVIK